MNQHRRRGRDKAKIDSTECQVWFAVVVEVTFDREYRLNSNGIGRYLILSCAVVVEQNHILTTSDVAGGNVELPIPVKVSN